MSDRSERFLILLGVVALVAIAVLSALSPSPPYGLKAPEPRSPEWPKVRAAHLAKHPKCEFCGSPIDPQVHHVLPFHKYPELELEESNLITLCGPKHRDHHLDIGHLGDFDSWNESVREWCKAAKERPR